MRSLARVFRWFGIALGLLIVVLLAAFGLLQTQPGKSWLERTIVQSLSSPDFAVTMQGLDGFVPFGLKVERIDIGAECPTKRPGQFRLVRDCRDRCELRLKRRDPFCLDAGLIHKALVVQSGFGGIGFG